MKTGLKTQVLIIGGGVTGTGLARDLSLRGVQCLLIEKGDLNAGASGANHGLLHSGARYVMNDPDSAEECRIENGILKHTAAHCIEETGGLFVAVEGDDDAYIRDFSHYCTRCGISAKEVSPAEARDMEPFLSSKTIAAFAVNDAAIDPFRLCLDNIDHAIENGASLMCHTRVIGFTISNKRIRNIELEHVLIGRKIWVEADQVVNAAGAWAAEVAALANVHIDMVYSKGSLLVTHRRISNQVINRLRPSSDGDIAAPAGTVSLIGTTSVRLNSLEDIRPTADEVDTIIEQSALMLPVLKETRFIRAYSGVRPLMGTRSLRSDRLFSRGFSLFDHAENKLENFATISGGKLTTYRYMAEKTADLVCNKLGVSAPCRTRTEPLPPSAGAQWTIPGLAAKEWLAKNRDEDIILCECEMVPGFVVDQIIEYNRKHGFPVTLRSMGQRSRIGKGACQGAFCSMRITAYMYDQEILHADQGVKNLRHFLNERWKGIQQVLWGTSLIQEELQEAMHCGFFSLEL